MASNHLIRVFNPVLYHLSYQSKSTGYAGRSTIYYERFRRIESDVESLIFKFKGGSHLLNDSPMRAAGVEPASATYKVAALPLSYTRFLILSTILIYTHNPVKKSALYPTIIPRIPLNIRFTIKIFFKIQAIRLNTTLSQSPFKSVVELNECCLLTSSKLAVT